MPPPKGAAHNPPRLQPELEARIAAEAATRGISLERYVNEIIADYAEHEAGLREGLTNKAAGRTRDARESFAKFSPTNVELRTDAIVFTEAARSIHELRKGNMLGGLSIRELMDEGHRY